MDQVFAYPQVHHLGMAREVMHPTRDKVWLVGQAVSMSRSTWEVRKTTPEAGEPSHAGIAPTSSIWWEWSPSRVSRLAWV